MKEEKLSGALSENILTLLIFSDEYSTIIRHGITPNLFESAVYKEIANHAVDFLDQFHTPIKEHLADSLEGILKGSDKRKASSYTRILDNLYLSKDAINGEYTLSQLHKFVRQQQLKSAVVEAVEAIEDGRIDQAELSLQRGLSNQVISFEPGILFSDPSQSLRFFEQEEDGILTGVEDLDRHGICLRPQELFLMIAPAKKGKSWWLTHIGKTALMQRKNVLHITLEMSEAKVAQRYVQSFFSITKRQAEVRTTIFKKNESGSLVDLDFDTVTRPTFSDAKMRKTLAARLAKEFKTKSPLMIKQFPTGQLTISMLKAYLDGLERFQKFVPDVILLDYPDLMRVDSDNLRLDLGQIFKEVRGIAVERNCAVGAVTQGNRQSATAKTVTDSMVAEDYSKIATADNVITYTQSKEEKALGLARLFVSNARGDEDKFTVLISQAYAMGQFCLDSTYMDGHAQDIIDTQSPPTRGKKKETEDAA